MGRDIKKLHEEEGKMKLAMADMKTEIDKLKKADVGDHKEAK